MKSSKEIRQEFIDFFKKYDHTFVPSSPVIADAADTTLYFTNAGMNQFKDVFLGTGSRPYVRAANSQKCIRVSGKHNDLEEVGRDNYHHTYFEMLGNWSFGDYFKEEAIRWAWELLTDVWGIPKERLYATVFGGDEGDGLEADVEAEQLWKSVTDIDPTHILRCDKKDNFWEMGASGPCGPCSEIHIDMTPDMSGGKLVNADSEEVIEIWNLVFIQFNRKEDGTLDKLPAQHVDTGMGFERIVRILQNKSSNYDTDIFVPIIRHIAKLAGIDPQSATDEQQVALQVVADHVRMLSFSIGDGEVPSNEGRGYVLRRILRRAARYGRKLNMEDPFIYKIVPTLVEINGEAFPELASKENYVMEVIKSEEESFNKTLDRGLEIFNDISEKVAKNDQRTIPGAEAFKLYDTYGFPLDLTQVLAEEKNMVVDEAGFNTEMEAQRQRGRAASSFAIQTEDEDQWEVISADAGNSFVGYEETDVETRVARVARSGDQYLVVLEKTPFYAESGGQVGDKGIIEGNGYTLTVVDTRKQQGLSVCVCEADGPVKFDQQPVRARVDMGHRQPTVYNHTATHLLQAALQEILGDHVRQKGSLVHPDYLRFDFTHFKKIEDDQLRDIELLINQKIQQDLPVEYYNTDFESAKAAGAMALFGEKYGDEVRVVNIAPFSMELCGGCHVKHTGEIGAFMITAESSPGSGIRRIEALSGPRAIERMQYNRDLIRDLGGLLNTPQGDLLQRVEQLLEQNKSLEKQLQKVSAGQILQRTDEFIAAAEKFGDNALILQEFEDVDVDLLKQVGDQIRQKTTNTVGFLVNKSEDRANFVCVVTDDLIKSAGLKAGDLVRDAAKIAGGGGGGRPHIATAGAKNIAKLPDVYQFIRDKISALTE